MTDCLFCKIIAKQIPSDSVYEDDHVYAFLDIHPVHPGHVLVIPKEHSIALHDAKPEVLQSVIVRIQDIAKAVMSATGAPAFNLMQNNGKEAGQAIPHLHFHIIPRFAEDGFKHWHGKRGYNEGEAKEIAEKIKASVPMSS